MSKESHDFDEKFKDSFRIIPAVLGNGATGIIIDAIINNEPRHLGLHCNREELMSSWVKCKDIEGIIEFLKEIQDSMRHRCETCNTAVDYPCYFAATSYRKEGGEPGYCLECFVRIMNEKMEDNKNAIEKR
jgi:hypothetical protein